MPDAARDLRRRAVLRRRHDHAGDLGAVRGRRLEVATPALKPYVVPITLVVLVVLFAVQRKGTARRRRAVRPGDVLWFVALACSASATSSQHPEVLRGAQPAVCRCTSSREPVASASSALGAVVLAVTGAEALYADMGHFGRNAHPLRLVLLRASRAAAQLLRPGRADAARPRRGRQSLLSAGAGMGAVPPGGARDRGDGDRLAGGDLRRVLR